jgi:hypothetical protein
MPIDPGDPYHDPNFLSARPTDPIWSDMSVTDPGGTHLGVIKSRSTGTIYHVGPDGSAGGVEKWLMSASLNSGAGGLLMTEADAYKIIAATGIDSATGKLQTPSGNFTGRQQQYMHADPLTGAPQYTNLTVYKLV